MYQGIAEHSLSLSVYEHYLHAFFCLELLKGLAEHIQLIVEDFGIRHAGSGIQNFRCMQVYHQRFVLGVLLPLRLSCR